MASRLRLRNLHFVVMNYHECRNHSLVFGDINGCLCFETPSNRRRESLYYTFFLSLSIPVIVFVLTLVVVHEAIAVPLGLAVFITGFTTLIVSMLAWHKLFSRMQFCIIFFPNHIQVGRGIAKCEFTYQDIEAIYTFSSNVIKIRCGKKSATVWLDRLQKPKCLVLLQYYCSNAITVDQKQQGHLPRNPISAERPLHTMERYYRNKALRFAFATCYLAFIFSCLFWGVLAIWNGNNILKRVLGDTLFHVLIIVGASACALIAWKSWCTARTVRNKRKQLCSSNNTTEHNHDL